MELERKTLQTVLSHERFRVPSISSKDTVKTAEQPLDWSFRGKEQQCVWTFCGELAEELNWCFRDDHHITRIRWELLWKIHIILHSSPCFWSQWCDFRLSSILGWTGPRCRQQCTPQCLNIDGHSITTSMGKEHTVWSGSFGCRRPEATEMSRPNSALLAQQYTHQN